MIAAERYPFCAKPLAPILPWTSSPMIAAGAILIVCRHSANHILAWTLITRVPILLLQSWIYRSPSQPKGPHLRVTEGLVMTPFCDPHDPHDRRGFPSILPLTIQARDCEALTVDLLFYLPRRGKRVTTSYRKKVASRSLNPGRATRAQPQQFPCGTPNAYNQPLPVLTDIRVFLDDPCLALLC